MMKKFIVFLLSLIIVGGCFFEDTEEAFGSGKIIYTCFTKGTTNNSGNGTQSSPYNLFETALLNASDGDTIYILEDGAFLNSSDNAPLIINKNITIKGTSSVFVIRTSGIVLGADVTFDNVVLSFGSRYHDAIFANGHNLTLKNVSCDNGTRKVDIFGGGLYINGTNVKASGTQSVITIDGGGSNFGNVYAGSMNGDFTGTVTLNLSNMLSARNTNVYVSGADEPYVNLDDLFNLEEPDAPSVNSNHTVSGNVNISVRNCNIPVVSQIAANSSHNSSLILDTNNKYLSAISVKNIDEVTVKGGGTFAPSELVGVGDITLSGGGLDLSYISTPSIKALVSDNSSTNRIVLGKNQYMTITDTLSGNFVFETENGYNGHSGPALYDFSYIRLLNTANASSASFSYTCVPGMEMTLDKINSYTSGDTGVLYKSVWKTSEAFEYSPFAITGLEISNSSITVTQAEFNNSVHYDANVSVSPKQANQNCYFDLVPIQYKVNYMGNEYLGLAMYDGYAYYSEIPELKISFMALSDFDLSEANICLYTYLDNSGNAPVPPAQGVYTISILPLSEGEQIVETVKLIITDENGNYPKEPETEPPTESPTTERPTTERPTTEPPTTEPPTTERPTTEPPTTECPTTEPPTTECPATESSTTEISTEPSTKEPLTTESPTTEQPSKGEMNSLEEDKKENTTVSIEDNQTDSNTIEMDTSKGNKLPKAVICVIIAGGVIAIGFGVVLSIKIIKSRM